MKTYLWAPKLLRVWLLCGCTLFCVNVEAQDEYNSGLQFISAGGYAAFTRQEVKIYIKDSLVTISGYWPEDQVLQLVKNTGKRIYMTDGVGEFLLEVTAWAGKFKRYQHTHLIVYKDLLYPKRILSFYANKLD